MLVKTGLIILCAFLYTYGISVIKKTTVLCTTPFNVTMNDTTRCVDVKNMDGSMDIHMKSKTPCLCPNDGHCMAEGETIVVDGTQAPITYMCLSHAQWLAEKHDDESYNEGVYMGDDHEEEE